jgi:hypothetical protein
MNEWGGQAMARVGRVHHREERRHQNTLREAFLVLEEKNLNQPGAAGSHL